MYIVVCQHNGEKLSQGYQIWMVWGTVCVGLERVLYFCDGLIENILEKDPIYNANFNEVIQKSVNWNN